MFTNVSAYLFQAQWLHAMLQSEIPFTVPWSLKISEIINFPTLHKRQGVQKNVRPQKPPQVLIDILLILSTAKLLSLHRRRSLRQTLIANKSFIHKKCILWPRREIGVGARKRKGERKVLLPSRRCRNVKQFEHQGFNGSIDNILFHSSQIARNMHLHDTHWILLRSAP